MRMKQNLQVMPRLSSAESVSVDRLLARRDELHQQLLDLPKQIREVQAEIDRLTIPIWNWGLSVRQKQVLALVLQEKVNKEIAAELYITERAAAYHVSNLLEKFGLKGYKRGDLIRKCREERYSPQSQ